MGAQTQYLVSLCTVSHLKTIPVQPSYVAIFRPIEQTLKTISGLTEADFATMFATFRNTSYRHRSDDEYFAILRSIVFYSGFKAHIVTDRLPIIERHLPDFRTIAAYQDKQINAIWADRAMIKHRQKIAAIIKNAQVFQQIVGKHGSFQHYLDSFDPTASLENLMLLKEEIEYRFAYLGGITVYHYLTDIGLEVIKPDRVLIRIFLRLGLIDHSGQLFKTIIHGRKFASANNLPIRYIDAILVRYGQADALGVCLAIPKCHLCSLTDICHYYKGTMATTMDAKD